MKKNNLTCSQKLKAFHILFQQYNRVVSFSNNINHMLLKDMPKSYMLYKIR